MGTEDQSGADVLLRVDEPNGVRAVVIEDDGAVAYAYLLERGEIVGDVWLYNVGDAPGEADWSDRSKMPFRNRSTFTEGAPSAPRLTNEAAVRCTWSEEGVEVYVDDVRWARLERGARPGWSRFVTRAGPLARPLDGDHE